MINVVSWLTKYATGTTDKKNKRVNKHTANVDVLTSLGNKASSVLQYTEKCLLLLPCFFSFISPCCAEFDDIVKASESSLALSPEQQLDCVTQRNTLVGFVWSSWDLLPDKRAPLLLCFGTVTAAVILGPPHPPSTNAGPLSRTRFLITGRARLGSDVPLQEQQITAWSASINAGEGLSASSGTEWGSLPGTERTPASVAHTRTRSIRDEETKFE